MARYEVSWFEKFSRLTSWWAWFLNFGLLFKLRAEQTWPQWQLIKSVLQAIVVLNNVNVIGEALCATLLRVNITQYEYEVKEPGKKQLYLIHYIFDCFWLLQISCFLYQYGFSRIETVCMGYANYISQIRSVRTQRA